MLKATSYPAGSEFSKLEAIRISLFCQIESLALSFFKVLYSSIIINHCQQEWSLKNETGVQWTREKEIRSSIYGKQNTNANLIIWMAVGIIIIHLKYILNSGIMEK